MEDIEAMVYPLLGLWVFVRLEHQDVSLYVTISLVAEFQKCQVSSNS